MLKTEQRNPYSTHIDKMASLEMMEVISRENFNAAKAVENALPQIAEAVDKISERINKGGRLFYIGCGTSGRLGILDASECPPTYGVSPDMVVGLISGGDKAIRNAVENAEDNYEAGQRDISEYNITELDSVAAIRKSFARQLTHSNAFWWFDMWGGWYDNPTLMSEMKQFREIMGDYTNAELPKENSDVVLVIDETYHRRIGTTDPMYYVAGKYRIAIGNAGIPYDIMMVEDFEHCKDYKAVIMPYPEEYFSDNAKVLKAFCQKHNVPVLTASLSDMTELDTDVLRKRLIGAGVHCYCDTDDIVYCGNGYISIHSATKGKKVISLPLTAEITPLNSNDPAFTSDKIEVEMKEFETLLFKIN